MNKVIDLPIGTVEIIHGKKWICITLSYAAGVHPDQAHQNSESMFKIWCSCIINDVMRSIKARDGKCIYS